VYSYCTVFIVIMSTSFSLLSFSGCLWPSFQVAQAQQQAEESFWFKGNPTPTLRTDLAAINLAEMIYIIGGYDAAGEGMDSVEVYNATNNSWSTDVAPLPVPLNHPSTATYNGKIYVAGGYYYGEFDPSDQLFIYDPMTNSWSEGSPMPTARGSPNAHFVNGMLYVIGGEANGEVLSINEAYDPTTDEWVSAAPMPTARQHAASSVVNGSIYVFGGRVTNSLDNTDVVEKYDPAINRWTTDLAPMPSKRSGSAATTLNDFVYVFGGEQNEGTFNNNERYDPQSDTWTILDPMPTARHGLGVASYDSKIFTMGGGPQTGLTVSNLNEIFNVRD
jgi:N-acetylneuraminic acid mutarotase